MLIGFDLDSVLADLIPPLNQYIHDLYGINRELSDYTDCSLSQIWNIPDNAVVPKILDFYHSVYSASINPVPGSVAGIHRLAKFHQVCIITSRPDSMKFQTLAWVNQYFPNFFTTVKFVNQLSHPVTQNPTKGTVAKELHIDIFIDDNFEYCQEVATQGIKTFLFTQPWNIQFTQLNPIIRVLDWPDLVSKIL